MAAPVIYSGIQTGAPILHGGPSTLIDILDACLRTGYGGAFAQAVLTGTGTPADGDTVTLGSVTYTFKTALTPTINEVLIGGSLANALTNLRRAVNRTGTPGTNYAAATVRNPDVTSPNTPTATVATFYARYSGNDNDRGGTIASTETSANLSFGGSTFSGGTQGKATGTLTSDNTVPANNDTVVLGNKTYTFKTTLTGAANEIFIGADADTTLQNLRDAINGTSGNGSGGGAGSEYGTGTTAHTQVTSSTVSAHAITVTAIYYGTAPNSYATTETSSHLSWGATTLTGGSGKDPQGWTKPFTGTDIAVFKQPSGSSGFYLRVNDSGPGAGSTIEARIRGWEVKADANDTADASNTGPFPTAAQLTNGLFVRKLVTLDNNAANWIVAADDKTVYFFALTGDISNTYLGFMFGDVYSYVSADAYKCEIIGRITENSGAASQDTLSQMVIGWSGLSGHYIARAYTGTGGSANNGKAGAQAYSSALAGPNAIALQGILNPPNVTDGGYYIAPVYINESGSNAVRGKMRGFWHFCHVSTAVADGDTWTAPAGSPWAGRSFLVIKSTDRTSVSSLTGIFLIETTAWDTSS